MWNPRISSLGGIFIGEDGWEQFGTDEKTFFILVVGEGMLQLPLDIKVETKDNFTWCNFHW